MGTTVQNTDDLPIAFDGHPRNRVACRKLEVLDAHLSREFTPSGADKTLEEFGVKIGGKNGHAPSQSLSEPSVAAARLAGCRTPKSLPSSSLTVIP